MKAYLVWPWVRVQLRIANLAQLARQHFTHPLIVVCVELLEICFGFCQLLLAHSIQAGDDVLVFSSGAIAAQILAPYSPVGVNLPTRQHNHAVSR